MIFVDQVNVRELLGEEEIVMCRREFARDATFNVDQRGMRFDEYEGKTLDELYPYVGCATATRDGRVWQKLYAMLDGMDEKFRKWYGDQEALREYAKLNLVRTMPESVVGCLPEHKHDGAKIIHYKGPSRKQLFEAV